MAAVVLVVAPAALAADPVRVARVAVADPAVATAAQRAKLSKTLFAGCNANRHLHGRDWARALRRSNVEYSMVA